MKLRNRGQNPPGCFFYVVPETGTRIPQAGATSFMACYEAVREHLHENGYTPPAGLMDTIEDFCCHQTEPGQCKDDKRMRQPAPLVQEMGISRIAQGAKSLASWLLEGCESEEVAQRRAAICTLCVENQAIDKGTCSGCRARLMNRLSQFIEGVLKGKQKAEWEKRLEACRICGCPLRLKVRTKLAPIRKYMYPEQLTALPPSCWINTEKCE